MSQNNKIRHVMTKNPRILPRDASALEAAQAMREENVGGVLVAGADDKICGIVTDRDVTIRVTAAGLDPKSTQLGDVCSDRLTTVAPDDSIDHVIELMRRNCVRRIPVLENGKPVGILSLGDLATVRDPKSVLGEISAAPPQA